MSINAPPESAGSDAARRQRRSAASSSSDRSSRPSPKTLRRRRGAAALLSLLAAAGLALVLGLGSESQREGPRGRTGQLRVTVGGRVLARYPVSRLTHPRAVVALLARVPTRTVQHSGRAAITLRTDRPALARDVRRAVTAGGGLVAVPRLPVASTIHLPVVKQALRDNCETAALSMVLSYEGRRANQLVLQNQVAHSAPLDPQPSPDGGVQIWGDPNQGFVGRADGAGPAGGYGVYQRPIAALAHRHGVELRDLTGQSVDSLYRAVLTGHPVMAWIALSDGPYATWRSPEGRLIHVNYGEHAVVVTGVSANSVRINDPLSGTDLIWTRADFEGKWTALGRRALVG